MPKPKKTAPKKPRKTYTRKLTLPPPETCFRRIGYVEAFTGLRRTALLKMVMRDEFPAPFSLSDSGRALGWLDSELEEWKADRLQHHRKKDFAGYGSTA